MWPEVTILGYKVSSYGAWIFIGVIFGIGMGIFLGKKEDLNIEDIIFASTYGILGVIIGGKLLYILIEMPWIIRNFYLIIKEKEVLLALFTGGFVFYGGLIGGFIGIYFYCRRYSISISKIISIIIIIIPLIHAFGRIGCFSVGCCYGIEYSGIGNIIFLDSVVAPNGISLFPVQLIESFINIIIFFILLMYRKKGLNYKKLVSLYLLIYSAMRFCLEFFRGDNIRGIILGLSTSQWISIVIFSSVIIWIKNKRRQYS